MAPTAAYADIVLPIASAWEREGLRVGFGLDRDACELVQFRPAVVAPRGEARADIDIVFDLAVRLGLGNHFWHGNVLAALDHHLEPSGLNLEALRAEPRGIRVPLETTYRKYRHGGFATPSGRIEIFSAALQEIGEPPLPEFRRPVWAAPGFPMTLTSAKTPLYCHSQHRNLAPLRRLEPDPVAEISPLTAAARDIGDGDWLAITTPRGGCGRGPGSTPHWRTASSRRGTAGGRPAPSWASPATTPSIHTGAPISIWRSASRRSTRSAAPLRTAVIRATSASFRTDFFASSRWSVPRPGV